MNSINKTLYIPLYGKAYVSKRGLFLKDPKAEEIWAAAAFPLKGKAESKWLAFYLGIRAAVFDDWVKKQMEEDGDCIILHLGCGLDSRCLRAGDGRHPWYDVDQPAVMDERKEHYAETAEYHMLSGDLREDTFLRSLPGGKRAIVVLEGVGMYMKPKEMEAMFRALAGHFQTVALLVDCYTPLAARMSRIKNPIKTVGVEQVYAVAGPEALEAAGFSFLREHDMTPNHFINELQGMEKVIFKKLYAGRLSRKLYRMYEYRKA